MEAGDASQALAGNVASSGNYVNYNDPNIEFENYHYWANQTRAYERTIETQGKGLSAIFQFAGTKKQGSERVQAPTTSGGDGNPNGKLNETPLDGSQYGITETELSNAQRAVRTATWGSVFYLITTDILGPYNVPWAISQMGYGPGFALYTVFGGLAAYSGIQLWQIFIGLDSARYPLRNYGDLAFRVCGQWARYITNILQSFQFFMNIALIIVSNAQSLAQMAVGRDGNVVVAQTVVTIASCLLGQIRTLQRLSWVSNFAVWLNVFVMIMTMIVTHKYPPNYAAAEIANNVQPGPIVTSANWPAGLELRNYINGLMNCVFAYGGATLFNEFMAEMRRPMDFWKALICAETFIYCCYLIMGMVVYSTQGQFTYPLAYQGIPSTAYAWQTVGNALSLVSVMTAGVLYGNIGIKIIYASIFRDIFKFPPLDHKKGKIIWIALTPVYWSLAFVLAAAIPQIANLTAFIGAACILQFSYTFPPLLKVLYNIQKDAMLPEETFDPNTGQTQRVDSGIKRWVRGYTKKLFWNTFDLLYGLAALGTAGLGIWASSTSMREQFRTSKITPFTCQNPAG
ncbi:hypothetical protein P280DRAFT_500390 [Massarina eburnea CBS 473.64]|uniref:Amino acid transporter transmembrane domain-containing protein n=1 Tax=Massarina eburnea CBS 473.64 TaxID=1395130 RepID=A0A6A6RUE7_9PLEO|nr:hypothetical protein P280DRAFT_500390 [Massarina eburnea CBS 473.64]